MTTDGTAGPGAGPAPADPHPIRGGIVEAWPEIRAILSETPGPEVLGDQLRRAGFDPADFRALYGEENIRAGVRYCNDMKVKHTLIQVIEDAGLLERYAAEIEI